MAVNQLGQRHAKYKMILAIQFADGGYHRLRKPITLLISAYTLPYIAACQQHNGLNWGWTVRPKTTLVTNYDDSFVLILQTQTERYG